MIALFHGLDNGTCVDTGARFKGVFTEDGIIAGQGDLDVIVGLLHVFVEQGQIILNDAHQTQVHQRLIQWCVSGSLTHTECGAMDDIRAGLGSGQIVGNT